MSRDERGRSIKAFSLNAEQGEKVEQYLTQIHRRIGAISTLLVDIAGQLLVSVGEASEAEPVTVAALAASNMAATAEMARLAGEPSPYPHLYHEGERRSIYLTPVGERFLLVIVFDRSVQVGLVRLLAKVAAKELMEIVASFEPLAKIDGDVDSLMEELNRAFRAWD